MKSKMKLVLGNSNKFEYPLMLQNDGRTAIAVTIINKKMFSARSQEMKILKEGLRGIAAKLNAMEKTK